MNQRGISMPTVEIRVSSAEFFVRMNDMREWLDSRGFEPAQFKSTGLGPETIITVNFKTSAEADAFAKVFGESMSSTSAVAGAVPQVKSRL
jgi:hypothetical protein